MRALLVFFMVTLCALPLVAPVTAQAQDQTLDAAYQKEFAYLLAEKQALQERLGEEKVRGERAISTARSELDTLQGRLVRMQTEAEAAETQLSGVERAA
ncbi:MAG: hypothetical protein AB8H79_25345, partial [Myxococcota bacterium]